MKMTAKLENMHNYLDLDVGLVGLRLRTKSHRATDTPKDVGKEIRLMINIRLLIIGQKPQNY